MTGKNLLRKIKAHLKVTGESPYDFGRRVLRDQTFVYKLTHYDRNPYRSTVRKVERAIARRTPK